MPQCFDRWKAALDREAKRRGVLWPLPMELEYGPNCWRGAFAANVTPAEAIDREDRPV